MGSRPPRQRAAHASFSSGEKRQKKSEPRAPFASQEEFFFFKSAQRKRGQGSKHIHQGKRIRSAIDGKKKLEKWRDVSGLLH